MITKTIRYELANGIATITFDEQGSPVNTMCLQWQDDLDAVTAQVLKDREQIKGIVLASAKSTFFAGADLKGVMRSTAADGPRVFTEIERIKRNFRTIETQGVPVVTSVGTATEASCSALNTRSRMRVWAGVPSLRSIKASSTSKAPVRNTSTAPKTALKKRMPSSISGTVMPMWCIP